MTKNIWSKLVSLIWLLSVMGAQAQNYGSTDFETSGAAEAKPAFILGLLKMHNFEYEDARASFQEAIAIDPDFTMAYWGEALSYEQSFWRRYDTEKSRAVLQRLGETPAQRAAKAVTQREKDYLHSIELLFGEGSQQERELAYEAALKELHEKYPDDLDAAALYALSILVTSYEGRDYSRYMRAGAITEAILDINPRHPGALHYNIHSYDDPIHAPLGLRAAEVYNQVAPSAVHALHMGSHIYYALGMWEEGVERNIRSFEEAVSRQDSADAPYGNQAYHALTWVPYGFQQMGENELARNYIDLIARQVERYGENNALHRNHYATVRASYLVDTQDWDSPLARVKIDRRGMSNYALSVDLYIEAMLALREGDLDSARAVLAEMPEQGSMHRMPGMEGMLMTGAKRADVAPGLMRSALEGQIEMASGNSEKALQIVSIAEQIEGALPSEYGPAVPVQPMAELLADLYRQAGNKEMARSYYETSLARAVGRIRSVLGLESLN